MNKPDPAFYHKLYGTKKPRVTYYTRDFLDYVVMILLTAVVVGFSYGFRSVTSSLGFALCAFALAMFMIRHGIELGVPLILRRPQDILYMFVHKLQNVRPMYLVALGLLLLENALIAATPNLPHHVQLMHKIAVTLFFGHFIVISSYRTAILIAHLARKELIREVLMQTPWKRVVDEKTNITLEILHAYGSGLLAHILLIAPWYVVIRYSSFSVIFLPALCVIDVVIHIKWMKAYNSWFYRDHWLGHNSELQFLFLHGTHHDAIPSALIAVSDSGLLEGFVRFAIASPVAFYNPVIAFLIYMFDVKSDIDMHQYIPGIYPKLPRRVLEVFQHSTHHYGRLDPYGVSMKLDQPGVSEAYKKQFALFPDEMTNSFKLDEELTHIPWDNPTHQSILSLWDKYQQV